MNPKSTILGALLAVLTVTAPAARADYAVLKSGVRLHITGYERSGARVRLMLDGGTAEIAADDLARVEPEDSFVALPVVRQAVSVVPYEALIYAAAKKHGLDENLLVNVIAAESNFKLHAVSRKQARGLMQLMPQTAARYAVANVFNPAQNIDAGARYLKELLTRYRGDLALALAAYNAGPGAIARYGGMPPFPETRNYVRKITASLAADGNP